MPERDPDEILAAFAELTERVPTPSPKVRAARRMPAFTGAVAAVGVVVLVAGLAVAYGPRLLPGRPPASLAETPSPPTLDGYVAATWRLGPGAIVTPDSTRIDVLLTETECSNGMSPEGRIGPPEISYGQSAVVVTLSVVPIYGDCPSNPDYPMAVELTEPIGNRQLIDGSNNDVEWQLRRGLVELRHGFEVGVQCYPTYLEGAHLAGDAADPAALWVTSETGQRADVLWPIGYGAVFDGVAQLVGPSGATVASDGSLLTLAGGFAPTGEFAACEVHVGSLEIAGDPLPWPTNVPIITKEPPPQQVTPSPPPATDGPLTTEPPTTNPPSSDSPFRRVDDFIERDEQISSVATGGLGYVAVGWKTLPDDQCVEGRVWTSQDGRHWSRQQTEMAPLYLEEVIEFGGEVYAFGHENLGPGCSRIGDGTIWRSADGAQWSLAATFPNARGHWMDVAVTETRLFAVSASSAYGTWTWVTSDGSDWQRPDGESLFGHQLGSLGKTVVAAGEPYDTDVTGFEAKVSTDEGASWQDVSIDFDFWFDPSFAEHNGLLLAATHMRPSEFEPDQGIAMTSGDGFDWTIGAPNLAPAYAAVAIPDGFLTIANDGSTAISADGLNWFVGPRLPQSDDRQYPQEATAGATGVLIVTYDYRNVVEYDRHLWFAPFDALRLSNWTTPVALVE